MLIEPSNTFERLLQEVEDTPINAIRECQSNYKKAEQTHNQKLYETLALAVACIVKLRNSPEDRAEFLEQDFFKDVGDIPSDDDLPRLVLRFILGATKPKGTLYEQARSYAQVVQYFLEQGTQPHEVFQRLSESSVHGIKVVILKRRRQGNMVGEALAITTGPIRAVPKAHRGVDEAVNEPDLKDDEGGYDDDEVNSLALEEPIEPERRVDLPSLARLPVAPTAKGGGDGDAKSDKRKPFNPRRDVSFDAGPYFDFILNIHEGEEVTVTLQRTRGEGEWVELHATDAERQPPAHHRHQRS